MEALAPSEVFLFENFRLDPRGGGLFQRDHNGGFVPVAVGSRGLDVLGVLVARAGEIVSKEEIIAAVWPGTVVEDSNLTVQISALRRVLDCDRTNGSCIQTVSGRGYRLVSAITHPTDDTSLTGGDDENAKIGRPEPPAPLAANRGTGWRRLRYVFGGAASTRHLAIAATGAVLLLVLAVWALSAGTKPSSTPGMASAPSISQPFAAPRLSMVVLPFANLSNDPDQQYFADGITEDLTTNLSRMQHSFVISRNTAFTYRNKPIDTRQGSVATWVCAMSSKEVYGDRAAQFG